MPQAPPSPYLLCRVQVQAGVGLAMALFPTEGTEGTMLPLKTGVTAPDSLLRALDIQLCPGVAVGRSKISLERLKYHFMLLCGTLPFATTVVMTFQVKDLSPFYIPCFEADVTSVIGGTLQHVDSVYKIVVAIQNRFILKLGKRDLN